MRRTIPIITLLASSPLFFGAAQARIWHVTPDGTGDAPTILAAAGAAVAGDVIELADGIFRGDGNRDILIRDKGLTVRSVSGDPEACIIDCEGSAANPHTGVSFWGEEGIRYELDGVTIRNAYSEGLPGAAISCGPSPTKLSNLVIENNFNEGLGGGLSLRNGVYELIDCRFINNTARTGGGMICRYAEISVTNCSFIGNQAFGYGGAVAFGEPEGGWKAKSERAFVWGLSGFDHCTFIRNCAGTGGTLVAVSGTHILRNCTIFASCGRSSAIRGYCDQGECGTFHIGNSIIAFTQAGSAARGTSGTVYCSVIHGNAEGPGRLESAVTQNKNMAVDPLFCDPDGDDVSLRGASPCAAGNQPPGGECGLIGALGVSCATAERRASWGEVKSLFR